MVGQLAAGGMQHAAACNCKSRVASAQLEICEKDDIYGNFDSDENEISSHGE